MFSFRDSGERRVALVALAAGFVLGAAAMRGYGALNLDLRSRVRLYFEYRPPASRIVCTEAAESPIARFEAATIAVNGRLYVFGGFDLLDQTGPRRLLRATVRSDVYDPASDSWRRISDVPIAVTHAGIASDGDTIWLAGGFVGDHPGTATDAVWRYDTVSDRWSDGPPLPQLRASAPLVRASRHLHYFGGLEADRQTDSADHWALRLRDGETWERRADLPDARNHLGGIELDGLVYAIGGQHGHDRVWTDVASVNAYDPHSDSWRELASLPYGRSHFEPGTFSADGKIVIAGGRAQDRVVLYDITAYDPKRGVWDELAPLYAPLRAPTAALVGDRVVVGFGGALPTGLDPQRELRSCALEELGLSAKDAGAEGGQP